VSLSSCHGSISEFAGGSGSEDNHRQTFTLRHAHYHTLRYFSISTVTAFIAFRQVPNPATIRSAVS
jgi:hypothetical protein